MLIDDTQAFFPSLALTYTLVYLISNFLNGDSYIKATNSVRLNIGLACPLSPWGDYCHDKYSPLLLRPSYY